MIKSLWIEYMPQLTSMGGLRKKWYMSKLASTGDLRGNKFYLIEMTNRIVRLYVTMVCLLWTTEREKKKIVLAYKGCGHYCVAIQICHWLCTYGTTKVKQETCFARNVLTMTIMI